MRLRLILLLLVIQPGILLAQSRPPAIPIDTIQQVMEVRPFCEVAFIAPNAVLTDIYSGLQLTYDPGFNGKLKNGEVAKKLVMRISLVNSSDSVCQFWVFPGFYFPEVTLYQDINGSLKKLPEIKINKNHNLSYRQVKLGPGDSLQLVAELGILKTYNNRFRPRIINPVFLPYFMSELRNTTRISDITSYIFSGLLLMMILFSLASYYQGGRKEFLYYSFYALLTGGMLYTKAILNYQDLAFNFILEGSLDFILQCLGIVFYMRFMQLFLDTRDRHPGLHRLYDVGVGLLFISILAYSIFDRFTNDFVIENGIENLTKIFLMGMVVFFLAYSLRNWKDGLFRYLFWGNLLFLLFSGFSLLLTMRADRFGLTGFFGFSLLYYELGLFFELLFFLTALHFKNTEQLVKEIREKEMLRARNLLQEYEKEMAVYRAQQEERERISADMHDELGSGMTAIRLMSEIARNKMQGASVPPELEKISASANDVLNKMNAIIWSMNHNNDTLDSLLAYIRTYAHEFFENTSISCRVFVPEQVSELEISGVKRRNIFLCVKETLHNIVKHSGATQVAIRILIDEALHIEISDNGVGIEKGKATQFGNGLKNMKRRMETIGGSYEISSEEGTLTILRLPL